MRRFTTPVVLPGVPTNTDEAATKGYVDTGLGGKSDSGHSHSAVLVPFAPVSFSDAGTITLTTSDGKLFRGSISGNRTMAFSSLTDGHSFIVECLANSAQRTLTLSGVTAIVDSTSIVIPSGKRWWGGFLYSVSTLYLLASKVQP